MRCAAWSSARWTSSMPLRHSIPDFAAPIPKDPLRSLSDEIERVRATEPAVVRADIAEIWGDDPPPPWDAFVARPREMVDRLADALEVYWQATLADDWPQLRAVLEGEMLARAARSPSRGRRPSSRTCIRACAGATR